MNKNQIIGVVMASLLIGILASSFQMPTMHVTEQIAATVAAVTPTSGGCPLFHCTSEATGVMYQPIVSGPVTSTSTNAFGKLAAQGCSGDGTKIACLFTTDKVTSGLMKGTLKMLDAGTLAPIWGSAGVAQLHGATNTYDIASTSFSIGQVPVFFADGTIAAGDGNYHVLYDAAGKVLKKVPLTGGGKNMGFTPISGKYGIVSQTDGTLTLIDLKTWSKVGESLTIMVGSSTVSLSSPSSGSGGVLYVAATASKSRNNGYLFSVVVASSTGSTTLKVRGVYPFIGGTSASPVVVKPSISGFADNLVLIHTPGLLSDGATPKHRLMGLLDMKGVWKEAWIKPIDLTQEIGVAPTIDEVNKSLYFQYNLKDSLYQYNFVTGTSTNTYNIQTLGGLPRGFKLNGHIVSVRTPDTYTVLLSGFVNSFNAGQSGQYVVAFKPGIAKGQGTVVWKPKIAIDSDQYTAAWTLGPSSIAGVSCPIVVGSASGLTKICN